jgi:anaerobic selenocysteine-containing dehydrogenase
MTPPNRRAALKRMALASAAAAAASLMPDITFGDEVPRPNEAVPNGDGGAEPVWHKTPCRFCGVGCGLLVGIENGRAVAVRGDPDSPVNKGLACVKGYHSVQALYGGDRLTNAWVRRDGRLVRVPIAQALDLIFSNHFSRNEPGVFEPLREALLTHGDYYMHLADLKSYLEADGRLCQLYADSVGWARKAILNIAGSGKFSSDRTIAEYAKEIWNVKPCPVE